jgi:hypothetical protein
MARAESEAITVLSPLELKLIAALVAGWQSALACTAVGAIAIVVVSSRNAAKYFLMVSPIEKASPKARHLQNFVFRLLQQSLDRLYRSAVDIRLHRFFGRLVLSLIQQVA